MEKSSPKTKFKPIVLIILDGWGIGEPGPGNVLSSANLPTIKKLDDYYPHLSLQASGISVGLPWGEPGNSEVGHITLGTGKVVYQNMPRITMSIQDGTFYKNPVFLEAFQHAKKNRSAVHLMGLVGKGSVHSHIDHLYSLLEMAKYQKAEKVFLHFFTDGRDSAPTSGIESIKELKNKIKKFQIGKIASISGRFFSMDRNSNWDRTQKAYEAMLGNSALKTENPEDYLADSYKKQITDEYVEPAFICENGQPVGKIQNGDSVIFFNFREDRAKQITRAFCEADFSKFPTIKLNDLYFATFTQYEEGLTKKVAFPPIEIENCLGKILSEKKLRQLRIAETEKFAHVTYFFNGGREDSFPGEERIIIPSKDVKSFDAAPEMSAPEITKKVISAIESKSFDFILLNFANADIVGHTGNKEAAQKAVESIDENLEKIIAAALSQKGCLLITADHGNVEEIINFHTGEKDTEHSNNPVPLWFVTPANHSEKPREKKIMEAGGLLSDISPTILELMGIKKPEEMTGESLLEFLK